MPFDEFAVLRKVPIAVLAVDDPKRSGVLDLQRTRLDDDSNSGPVFDEVARFERRGVFGFDSHVRFGCHFLDLLGLGLNF